MDKDIFDPEELSALFSESSKDEDVPMLHESDGPRRGRLTKEQKEIELRKKRYAESLADQKRSYSEQRKAVIGIVRFLYRHRADKTILDSLKNNYISMDALVRADMYAWMRMGMVRREALLMQKLIDFTRVAELRAYPEKIKMGTMTLATPYLHSSFLGVREERFYLFCLNRLGNLKRRICLNVGTVDAALYNPQSLLINVLREQPAAVFIVHNHPGGSTLPSYEDLLRTVETFRVLSMVHLPLLDHVIVTQSDVVSIRDGGYIPERMWNYVRPNHPMMRRWLDENTTTGSILLEKERMAKAARANKTAKGAKNAKSKKSAKAAASAKSTRTAKRRSTAKPIKESPDANPAKTE